MKSIVLEVGSVVHPMEWEDFCKRIGVCNDVMKTESPLKKILAQIPSEVTVLERRQRQEKYQYRFNRDWEKFCKTYQIGTDNLKIKKDFDWFGEDWFKETMPK